MFNSATIDESRTSALHFANEMLQAGGEMLTPTAWRSGGIIPTKAD